MTVCARSGDARSRLALTAFLLLFVELALIRWLGANIIYLAYFSNFVLVGTFLGIGLGFLWASRSELTLFPLAPPLLAIFVAAVTLLDVSIEVGGRDLIFFADQRPVGPPRWVMLPIVFVAVAACVAAIADGVARNFSRLEPLEAYRWDLVGSILGVLGFSALSFLGSPPIVWGGDSGRADDRPVVAVRPDRAVGGSGCSAAPRGGARHRVVRFVEGLVPVLRALVG